MKQLIVSLSLLSFFSCNNHKEHIADAAFTDSLIHHYSEPAVIKNNGAEICFWKKRINTNNPGIVNESKYAANLVSRFHLNGDIRDVKAADSILQKIDSLFNHKEAAPNLAMVKHCILQHRFTEASAYLQKAISIGIKPYELHTTQFDVDFELGHYSTASAGLAAIRSENDYGYQFRKSKWEHYNGNMDAAIYAMQKAIELSGTDLSLQQAAISNTADLYLHNNELEKANELYMQSIRLGAADLHSIMGIGWIALVHDKKYAMAEKIFRFVQGKTKSPDPLYKLILVAQARESNEAEKKLANEFINIVNDKGYDNMYNKYLVELYNDVLSEPGRAEAIAKHELQNRATPQTYAWYAYSLFKNNKGEEALKVYQQQVSGKPLEGLELYWIGKMMQGLHKEYNAQAYLKEAYKNRYDLSPAKTKDLERMYGTK